MGQHYSSVRRLKKIVEEGLHRKQDNEQIRTSIDRSQEYSFHFNCIATFHFSCPSIQLTSVSHATTGHCHGSSEFPNFTLSIHVDLAAGLCAAHNQIHPMLPEKTRISVLAPPRKSIQTALALSKQQHATNSRDRKSLIPLATLTEEVIALCAGSLNTTHPAIAISLTLLAAR